MKFTLNWLNDFLESDASLRTIIDTLTAIGLEVEDVVDQSETLADFTVAQITDAKPHPDADKLKLCQVDDGSGTLRQIVCGAHNARAGIKAVLAKEGVTIPTNGMVIKKAKIRGVESNGMLCSMRELGLGEDHDGIIELPEHAQIGAPAAAALDADDPVIEIAITPNRGDCLGVYGIARDLAAAGVGTLKPLIVPDTKQSGASPVSMTIETNACSYFTGCTIENVKNVQSPDWLQRRLVAIGLRPISALVDITNYIMMSYGRPLHVYDADTLQGNIAVREAKSDETLAALDDKEYKLTGGMVAITDESGVIGLGGIIGGASTGCTQNTTRVFLESALFDPIITAQTGRKLELLTDARYRFERGVDPEFVDDGAKLALAMIVELCGGQASECVSAGTPNTTTKTVSFDPTLVKRLGGVDVSTQQCTTYLQKIGCTVGKKEALLHVTLPSWRPDLSMSADLVEEILRLNGYHHIPQTALPIPATRPALRTATQRQTPAARRVLAARGLLETRNWNFCSPEDAALFNESADIVEIVNPISSDLSVMRPSLLPHLLRVSMNNQNRSQLDLAIFEVGLQFSGIGEHHQHRVACGLRTHEQVQMAYPGELYQRQMRPVDAFDAKADAFALLAALGVKTEQLKITHEVPGWYHPGRSGAITFGGKKIIGYFGELHPKHITSFELTGRVSLFEIMLDQLPPAKEKTSARAALIRYDLQPVERDFAFVVDDHIGADELIRAVKSADKSLITGACLFDVYKGKGLEENQKSMAIRAQLQPIDQTLTEADITTVSEAIIASVANKVGGALR